MGRSETYAWSHAKTACLNPLFDNISLTNIIRQRFYFRQMLCLYFVLSYYEQGGGG